MSDYRISDYDLCRSALLECVMSDIGWMEVYTIIEHAETALEFDVAVQAQVDLTELVRRHYGHENE